MRMYVLLVPCGAWFAILTGSASPTLRTARALWMRFRQSRGRVPTPQAIECQSMLSAA